MVLVDLHARRLILDEIRRLGGDDFVLGATDAGRAKWVESLANDLGVEAAFILKRRLGDGTTQVTALAAEVRGRKVVIYDDLIRTGGSLIGAAQAYVEEGATSVAAVATHGVLPGDSLQRILESGLFTEVVCTDSHPRAVALADEPQFRVVSIAGLLADFLEGRPTGSLPE